MADNTIYRMNLNLAGFKKGDWWIKGTEPVVVTKWAELGGGVFGTSTILTIEERDPIELGKNKSEFTGICPKCGYNSDEKEIVPEPQPKEIKPAKDVVYCKGIKADGSPCEFSGNKVRENGYCFMHQNQAPKVDETSVDDETEKEPSDNDDTKEKGIFELIENEPEEGES